MKRIREQEDSDVEDEEEIADEEEDVNIEEADGDTHSEDPEPASSSLKPNAPAKKKKRGIIYLSTIPKHMTVSIARDMFNQYADVGRMYFQPSTRSDDGKSANIF